MADMLLRVSRFDRVPFSVEDYVICPDSNACVLALEIPRKGIGVRTSNSGSIVDWGNIRTVNWIPMIRCTIPGNALSAPAAATPSTHFA